MRNLILMLMLVMSIPAMAFMPGENTIMDKWSRRSHIETINDPYGIYKKYKFKIREKIRALRNVVMNPAFDSVIREDRAKTIKEQRYIKKTIRKLRRSTVVYQAVFDKNLKDTGYTIVDTITGKVVVLLPFSENVEEVWGHEIRHQFQYEKGQTSIMRDGTRGALHDLTDEEDACKAGMLLIDNYDSVVSFKVPRAIKGNANYQLLPKVRVDIYSQVGRSLKDSTQQAGEKGLPIPEYYKGWQLDYYRKDSSKR